MSAKKKVLIIGGVFLLGVIGGSALMYNNSVYHSVNDALGRGATQNAIANGATASDISNMDIETALMMAQSERTKLLETQLNTQIKEVQLRNEQLAKLNIVMNEIRAQEGQIPSDAGVTQAIIASVDLTNALVNAGLNEKSPKSKAELDVLKKKVESLVTSMTNSQQMDMLRLQSLTNKRNEGFDLITNIAKKMSDTRTSNIGNMR